MNCLYPDINNLRCWICPHNPFTRSMPPYVVCASLSPEMASRLRADCREDNLVVREFDLVFDLPAALGPATRERFKAMGFQVSDMPEGSPIPGNTRFSFSADNAFAKNGKAVGGETGADDEEDWDEDDEEEEDEYSCDGCPDYPCTLITGDGDDENDADDDEEDEDDEDDDWEDEDDESLEHLNDTLLHSLASQITDLQSDLDDLLQSIFDLYPLFPDRKDVLSDMEDGVVEMMDDLDDLLTLADAYGYEREED